MRVNEAGVTASGLGAEVGVIVGIVAIAAKVLVSRALASTYEFVPVVSTSVKPSVSICFPFYNNNQIRLPRIK